MAMSGSVGANRGGRGTGGTFAFARAERSMGVAIETMLFVETAPNTTF